MEKDTSTFFASPSCLPDNLGDTAAFDLATLLDKMQSEENNAKTLKCIQCNFTSESCDSLMIHVKYVHDTTFFTCDQCGRQTKTEEGLQYHIQMRHTENVKDEPIIELSTSTSAMESVRSSYILSKTIDGLEKSPIVSSTSLTVCMMKTDESDKSFLFQSRRIDGKKLSIEKDDNSYFRTTTEMEEEMKQKSSTACSIYLGNLKRQKAFITLKKDFLCVTDCELNGNLRETTKESMVFMKLLKCKDENGKNRHLPFCLKCNHNEKATSIIQSVKRNVIVTEKFKHDNIKPCIHSNVGELLFLKEASEKEDMDDKINCKVVVDHQKTHLSISFDGETHGLIFVNRAKKGNKGHCLKCKSIRCSHVQVWNKELKARVLKDHVAPVKDIETDLQDDRTSEDGQVGVENDETISFATHQRLHYPFDRETQERMRVADGSQYEDLIELISKPDVDEKCDHKNNWSLEDPRAKDWVYSRNVNISHSTYVKEQQRTVFYRRTTGDCNCILLYDGKSDMLLPVSHHNPQVTKVHNGRLGYKINLVSLSLLYDFANDFFKNGTTITGYFRAYKSKCTMKFGMDEKQVISWVAWRSACVEFITNILTINETEVFQCSDCGPRPKVLVIDGIAMGLKKSELDKYKEEMVKDLGYKSNIDIIGSNFKDRMFIKLSRNRKLLRKAAKAKDWPVFETNGDSDSDPEFEVGEKRKRFEPDLGMDLFWKFLAKLDKSVKPNNGIVLLMENLSASTSTIGLMQEMDETLIHKLELFLKGDQKYNFLSGIDNIDLHLQIRKKYPVLMKILQASVDPDGILGKPVRYQYHSL